MLIRIAADYPGTPLMITENGSAYVDTPVGGGSTTGTDQLLRRTYTACRGTKRWPRGLIYATATWPGSFLDNFEWGYGYDKRFGLVYVDYETSERTAEGQRPPGTARR